MSAYSTSYRLGSKLYKSMLENGVIHYTEELEYLITDHNSFQLFQPLSNPANAANSKEKLKKSTDEPDSPGRWLCPIDTLGHATFSASSYYDTLNRLELHYQSRIKPVKYSCELNSVFVTRTVFIDICWTVRQITQIILSQMHPQIEYTTSDRYRLSLLPQRGLKAEPLKRTKTLPEQGVIISQPPELLLLLKEDVY